MSHGIKLKDQKKKNKKFIEKQHCQHHTFIHSILHHLILLHHHLLSSIAYCYTIIIIITIDDTIAFVVSELNYLMHALFIHLIFLCHRVQGYLFIEL